MVDLLGITKRDWVVPKSRMNWSLSRALILMLDISNRIQINYTSIWKNTSWISHQEVSPNNWACSRVRLAEDCEMRRKSFGGKFNIRFSRLIFCPSTSTCRFLGNFPIHWRIDNPWCINWNCSAKSMMNPINIPQHSKSALNHLANGVFAGFREWVSADIEHCWNYMFYAILHHQYRHEYENAVQKSPRQGCECEDSTIFGVEPSSGKMFCNRSFEEILVVGRRCFHLHWSSIWGMWKFKLCSSPPKNVSKEKTWVRRWRSSIEKSTKIFIHKTLSEKHLAIIGWKMSYASVRYFSIPRHY